MKTTLMFLAIFAMFFENNAQTTIVVKNHPENPPISILLIDDEGETDEVLLGKFTGKILVEPQASCPEPGDLNADGAVNIPDLMIFMGQFGATMSSADCNQSIEMSEAQFEMKSDIEPGQIVNSSELLINDENFFEFIDQQQTGVVFEDIDEVCEEFFDIEFRVSINPLSTFSEGSWIMIDPIFIEAEDENGDEVDVVFAKGTNGNKIYLYSNVINVGPMSYVSWDVVTQPDGTKDVYFAYTADFSSLGDDELYIHAGASGWQIGFGENLQFEVTDFYCNQCDMYGEFFELDPEDIYTSSIWGIVENVPSGTFECAFTALNFYQSPNLSNPIPYPTELLESFTISVP